jgi:hypothetical protein
MRNLQTVLFLSLFGMTLAAGCTVTTTDGNAKGGEGGEDTTAVGGSSAFGGSSATAGGTAGTTTTTTAFTAADCTAAGAAVPAATPDITEACIDCIYSTACAQAVVCHNAGTCMTSTLKALECIELYYLYYSYADSDSVQACQDGTLTSGDTPADLTGVTVKSTDAGAWLGALVPVSGTAVVQECALQCHLSDT